MKTASIEPIEWGRIVKRSNQREVKKICVVRHAPTQRIRPFILFSSVRLGASVGRTENARRKNTATYPLVLVRGKGRGRSRPVLVSHQADARGAVSVLPRIWPTKSHTHPHRAHFSLSSSLSYSSHCPRPVVHNPTHLPESHPTLALLPNHTRPPLSLLDVLVNLNITIRLSRSSTHRLRLIPSLASLGSPP